MQRLRPARGARPARRAAPPRGPLVDPLLDLVALVRERGERCLEEVIRSRRRKRPREEPPEPRGDDLRRGEPARDPRADAAGAGHELADRLTEVARLDGLLAAVVRVAFDEG